MPTYLIGDDDSPTRRDTNNDCANADSIPTIVNGSPRRRSLGTDSLCKQLCHVVEDTIRHHHSQLNRELAAWTPQGDLSGSQPTSQENHAQLTSSMQSGATGLSEAAEYSAYFESSCAVGLQVLTPRTGGSPVPAPPITPRRESRGLEVFARHACTNSQSSTVKRKSITKFNSGESSKSPSRKPLESHEERDRQKLMNAKSRKEDRLSRSFVLKPLFEPTPSTVGEDHKWTLILHSILKRIVRSSRFDHLFGFLILANAVMVGVDTYLIVNTKDPEYSPWMLTVSTLFIICFVVELVLRISVEGFDFFNGQDKGWNIFDFVIVLLSLLQMFMDFVVSDTNAKRNLAVVSVMRSFRAFRIVRVMRAFRMLRPLRLLLAGIVGTLSSCFWALILLSLIIYTFGVTFTHAAVGYLYGDGKNIVFISTPDEPSLEQLFGTLPKSMNTLFQSICGGMNWNVVLFALADIPTSGRIYVFGFLVYIAFVYLGILNVLTALFCQHAVENALADQEVVLEGKLATMRQMEEKLKNLFRELDELDQSDESPEGMVTYAELEEFMEDRRIKAQLALLGLVPEDAWTLFKLLDKDEKNIVDTDEFVSGCMRLRGEATRMDVLLLASHTKSLEKLVIDFIQDFDSIATASNLSSLMEAHRRQCPQEEFQRSSSFPSESALQHRSARRNTTPKSDDVSRSRSVVNL